MDFDERRRQKYAAGRRERGLPLNGSVFIGNPCSEARDECADLANYVEQAYAMGGLPEQVVNKIISDVYGIDLVLGAYEHAMETLLGINE